MAIIASDGSQANIQSIHNNAATVAGDTITIPSGNYTWSTSNTILITKGITLRAVTVPTNAATGGPASVSVNITFSSGTGVYLIDITVPASGNTTLAGINFLPGNASGSTQCYVHTGGGPSDTGGSHVVLMNNCTFNIADSSVKHAVEWFSTGGVVWNCMFFGSTVNAVLSGNGAGSGVFYVESNIGWWVQDCFGTNDSLGTSNFYIENCVFNNLYLQCLDCGESSRAVIRQNIFNNSQCLTHGSTGTSGGREIEFYNNNCRYFPVSDTLNNGAFGQLLGTGQTVPGGRWQPMTRWFWWRAGTARVHDNTVEQINSFGWFSYGGNQSAQSWQFINESLTRNGVVAPCQTDSAYPFGWHWCGMGGNVTPTNAGGGFSNAQSSVPSYQISSPVYIWNNTYIEHPGSGTGFLAASAQWGTNDQTAPPSGSATCPVGNPGPVSGTNSTADTFLIGRDIFLTVPASGAGGIPGTYTPFTYPHPLISAPVDTTPPTQPQNLSATTTSSTSISLQWTTSTDTQTASASLVYDLERKTGLGSFATVPGGGSISGVSSGPITYLDTGLSTGTNYVYEVRAIDSAGNPSIFSATANATTSSVASAPLFVQSATDSGLPLTATYASAQTAGNTNVVVVGWQDNLATVATVSDAPGSNTYVLAGAATGQGLSQSIYIAKNIAGSVSGNVVTVTFTGTPFLPDLRISEYSGADLVTPLESITSSSGTTNAASCGPLVLTGTNDLLFSAETATLSPVSPGATFTQRSISAQGNITEDIGLSTTGSFSSSFTFGSLATPTMVQHVSTGTNSNSAYKAGTGNQGNNFKFFLPNVVRANNCVILCISNPFLVGRTITITDNIGTNIWGLASTVNNGIQMTSVYVSDGTAANTQRITVAFDTNLFDVHIDATEFYNVAASSAVDVSNFSTTSATSVISAGSITTTAANDLVYQVGFDTAHLNLSPPPSITNMTNSTGFTFLNADVMNGQFVQYGVVSSPSTISPSVTLTGSTDSFNTITISLKAASAGTPPPATGIRISSVRHVNMMRAVPMIIPSVGNLLYFSTAFGTANQIVSSISDSVNGTWTVVPAVAGGSGNGNPQCYYRINATPSNSRTLTVSGNTVSLGTQLTFLIYDIVNATTAPFDTSTSGSSTFLVGPISFGTIVPTTSNGLVIIAMATYQDALTAETSAAHTFDTVTYTNIKDADLMDNVDGYAHVYNQTASSVQFTWTLTSASVPPFDTQSTEQYTISAFKGT